MRMDKTVSFGFSLKMDKNSIIDIKVLPPVRDL